MRKRTFSRNGAGAIAHSKQNNKNRPGPKSHVCTKINSQ